MTETPPQSEERFVHPNALCESDDVGAGSRIWAFAHVMAGARIGDHCNIGDHVFVESGAIVGHQVTVKNRATIWEGVTIEDDAFIGPGVLFTNDRRPRSPRSNAAVDRYRAKHQWLERTIVQTGASLGAGAIICCGLTVGRYAMVGAGSVVTRNVEPHRLVAGNPARPIGWVCRCGARVDSPVTTCPDCDVAGKRPSAGAINAPSII